MEQSACKSCPVFAAANPGNSNITARRPVFIGGAFYTASDSATLEKRGKSGDRRDLFSCFFPSQEKRRRVPHSIVLFSFIETRQRVPYPPRCSQGVPRECRPVGNQAVCKAPAIIARPLTSPVSVDLAAPLQTAATATQRTISRRLDRFPSDRKQRDAPAPYL